MSYLSHVNMGTTDSTVKNLAKYDGITDPALKKTAEMLDDTIENLQNALEQLAPKGAHVVEKAQLGLYGRGFSQGEIKRMLQKTPELQNKLEISADKKLMSSMLKRQGFTMEDFTQILKKITVENKEAVIKMLNDKELTNEQLVSCVHLASDENIPHLQTILKKDKIDIRLLRNFPTCHLTPDHLEILRTLNKKGIVESNELYQFINHVDSKNSDIAIMITQKGKTINSGHTSILRALGTPLEGTEENLAQHKMQKKFFIELLDNPEFKLPEDEVECYILSKVIAAVNSENYDVAQKALLSNINITNIDDFIAGINSDNKSLAFRMIDIVDGEVSFPEMDSLEPQYLERYLDKVEKITDSNARKDYINALEILDESNSETILSLVESSDPTKAKHASVIIQALSRGFEKIEDIEPTINFLEKSGREFDNDHLVNLAVYFSELTPDDMVYLDKVLKNQKIDNVDIAPIITAYLKFAVESPDEITKMRDYIDLLASNEDLSSHEISSILKETNQENIDVLSYFAATPQIKEIDPTAICDSITKADVDAVLTTDIPESFHREVLPYLRSTEFGAAKRLEVAQKLAQRTSLLSEKGKIIRSLDDETMKYIDDILACADIDDKTILNLIEQIKEGKGEILKELLQNPKMKGEYLESILDQKDILSEYRSNPEQTLTAFELKMPLLSYDASDRRSKLTKEILGENIYINMLQGLQQVKDQYGINPTDEMRLRFNPGGANDSFINLCDDTITGTTTYKFDKKTGNIISVSTKDTSINLSSGARISDDVSFEHTLFDGEEVMVPLHIETVQKGDRGTLRTTYSESGIKGQYDVYHLRPDGSRAKVGRAQVTPNGAQHVSRTLTSANGHKTSLSYRKDAAGNTYLHSVIKNESGEIISEVMRKRKVISENHFITTYNDNAFDIIFSKDRVIVSKLDSTGKKTGETIEYAIKDIPFETSDNAFREIIVTGTEDFSEIAEIFKRHGIEPKTIDRRCVAMLKELPGDEWFAMAKCSEFVMPQSLDEGNAFYAGNCIGLSKEQIGNLGVLCHELGHGKFAVLDLANDPELLRIYNAEKERYTSMFPETRIESISYFLEQNNDGMRGLNEACAETNLVSDTIQSWDVIQDRTIFYEQYFPETIAYVRQRYAELI